MILFTIVDYLKYNEIINNIELNDTKKEKQWKLSINMPNCLIHRKQKMGFSTNNKSNTRRILWISTVRLSKI